MGLPPSGFEHGDVELVVIETSQLSLYIKGKPYHRRYENFQHFQKELSATEEMMSFSVKGKEIEKVEVLDVREGKLVSLSHHPPIFFESGVYQLVASSKKAKTIRFHHEHTGLRRAIGVVGKGKQQLLMGNLQFVNEIGLTSFEIYDDEHQLLEVTLEIFPSKLDYRKDYQNLLQEVSAEIYNLSYHFIKKTYLGASAVTAKRPSPTEFYRLLERHFGDFILGIRQIRRQPHHELKKHYQKVRGDQLKQLDAKGRRFLQRRAYILHEVQDGINLSKQKSYMPEYGLNVKKRISFDTLENRFVKWMMGRLIDKLSELYRKLNNRIPHRPATDEWLNERVVKMKRQLKRTLNTPFWWQIGRLDRSVISHVMQMRTGYRETFQIYLLLSRGLALEGHLYHLSVKDVATLYEYWTFLKIGQILGRKYETVSQDIIKVTSGGLFVKLDQSISAKRTFRHPYTREVISLYFQKRAHELPTVRQKPDIVLQVEKKGKAFSYQFIFDAKYRIDFAAKGGYYERVYGTPGPLEEDINTMHRYRDALVVKQGGPFERDAFGAYVLFPWADEDGYEDHHFYQSIGKVNIGGLPFLPNSTRLVEQFLQHLIEKGAEEIQQEGILPRGTKENWRSSLDEKVMVGLVKDRERFKVHWREKFYHIPLKALKQGWQEAKYLALYLPKKVTRERNGIYFYGEIIDIEVKRRDLIATLPSARRENYVVIHVSGWRTLDHVIPPVGYGIRVYTMTTFNALMQARELPELFMKSKEEVTLWRILRRLSNRVQTTLDKPYLDQASVIQNYKIENLTIVIDKGNKTCIIEGANRRQALPLDWLINRPSRVFKVILSFLKQ